MRMVLVAATLLALADPAWCQQPAQPPADPARAAALAGIQDALGHHDTQRAIALESDWARQHPTDFEARHDEPLLYRLAGDASGWEHARVDLLRSWVAARGRVPPPANPSFVVDIFRSGADTVVADQCYERGGRFGVIYRFTVFGPDRRSTSFFTVESPEEENRIHRELGQPAPVYALDHFRPGIHETVAMLPGLPPYDDLRQRVLAFMADPRPLSASRNGDPALSTENCGLNRPGASPG